MDWIPHRSQIIVNLRAISLNGIAPTRVPQGRERSLMFSAFLLIM